MGSALKEMREEMMAEMFAALEKKVQEITLQESFRSTFSTPASSRSETSFSGSESLSSDDHRSYPRSVLFEQSEVPNAALRRLELLSTKVKCILE